MTPPVHFRIDPASGDAGSIVVTDMQNEADALNILALASPTRGLRTSMSAGMRHGGDLRDFTLVQRGILSEDQLVMLTEVFFGYHHHFYVSPGRS